MVLDRASEAADDELRATAGSPGRRFWKDLRTVPNVLSLIRFFVVFVAATFYIYGDRGWALAVGSLAAITDMLDGYLARKLDQSTALGAILDRLSDLVLETACFVVLLHFHLLSPVYFFAYLLRELAIMSARQHVAEGGGTIPTSFIGRLKTNVFVYSFLLMFLVHAGAVSDPETAELLDQIGEIGVVLGLIVSYVSGAQYLRVFIAQYRGANH